MVLIITSFGATRNYPDQEMMKRTLTAFLRSLERQTDKDFRLFISCHDVPEMKICHLPFIEWCRMGGEGILDKECGRSLVLKTFPEKLTGGLEYLDCSYHSKVADMSRKTINSAVQAGLYAYDHGLNSFWMLRMDSDDLLAEDHIAFLNLAGIGKTFKAVYNMNCHIYDPKTEEFAIQHYPYSTTCNALLLERQEEILPLWDYLCTDHTLFMSQVYQDKIPAYNQDFALCITTNSGNSLSGRSGIREEPYCERVALTQELKNRYGLDAF